MFSPFTQAPLRVGLLIYCLALLHTILTAYCTVTILSTTPHPQRTKGPDFLLMRSRKSS